MPNKTVRPNSRTFAVAAICAGGLFTALFFQNCGKVGSSANSSTNSSASESGSGGGGGGGGGGASAVPLTMASAVPMQTTNLGTTLTIPIDITVPTSYSGTLKFQVKTPELSAIDTGAGIKFSFSPATVAVTGQGHALTTLTVNVTTLAPSFNLSQFHVFVSDMNNSSINGDFPVGLQVNAIYEVVMSGPVTPGTPSPEKFSVAIGSVTQFISHTGGLTFRFLNMATGAHRVHSSGGPIPHQPADMAAGGNYTIMIPAGATKVTSLTYCHDHEGGGQGRTFQFNVPVVPVAPVGASGNPNASFAYLNTNVFAPKCLSCHSTANPSSGVNVSSYTNVLAFVTKGDASVSAIFNAIDGATPDMPLGGPALSAALVKDVSDWINDGAPNN